VSDRLYRSPDDRIIAGVAGGIAETYDLDPALVRIGWALLILLTGGLMLVPYVVMVLVVPLRPSTMALWATTGGPSASPGPVPGPGAGGGPFSDADRQPEPGGVPPAPPSAPYQADYRYGRRRHRGDAAGAIVIGSILIIVGAFLLVRQFIPQLDFGLLWPLIIIIGGVLLIYAAYTRPRRQP